jgi:hypothetical protein
MPLKRNSVSEASRFAPDLKKQARRFVYLAHSVLRTMERNDVDLYGTAQRQRFEGVLFLPYDGSSRYWEDQG